MKKRTIALMLAIGLAGLISIVPTIGVGEEAERPAELGFDEGEIIEFNDFSFQYTNNISICDLILKRAFSFQGKQEWMTFIVNKNEAVEAFINEIEAKATRPKHDGAKPEKIKMSESMAPVDSPRNFAPPAFDVPPVIRAVVTSYVNPLIALKDSNIARMPRSGNNDIKYYVTFLKEKKVAVAGKMETRWVPIGEKNMHMAGEVRDLQQDLQELMRGWRPGAGQKADPKNPLLPKTFLEDHFFTARFSELPLSMPYFYDEIGHNLYILNRGKYLEDVQKLTDPRLVPKNERVHKKIMLSGYWSTYRGVRYLTITEPPMVQSN